MKTLFQVCGSISKTEVLSQIQTNIMHDTCVAEASEPYAGYYGGLPENAKPNSLFLFTQKFYFLEDILSLKPSLPNCKTEKLNLATAIVTINHKQFPAIRLKFFPNYNQLGQLQECFTRQGIIFSPPLHLQGRYFTQIHKLFELEETEHGIYFDRVEENKGYFTVSRKIMPEELEEINRHIKNNSSCRLFDAAPGSVIVNGKITEIVRVFAEGVDDAMLKCIQKHYEKLMVPLKMDTTTV